MKNPAIIYKFSFCCKSKKWYFFTCAVIVILLLHYISFSYKKTVSVDVSSGRIMRQTIIGKFVCVEEIEDTILSKLLQNTRKADEPPKWRFDGSSFPFTPCQNAYECVMPNFTNTIAEFEFMVEACELPDETQVLLAVAIQKWMQSIVLRDAKYDNPMVEITTELVRLGFSETDFFYLYKYDCIEDRKSVV